MKVLYIANLNLHVKGGLFKATFERISRMKERVDSTCIINNNFYDSTTITAVKKLLRMNDIRNRKPDKSHYKNIEITNANYKRTVFFYLKRLLHLKSTENGMIDYYAERYKKELESTDLIHAHFGWTNGYIAYRLSQIFDKPYFITLHGSDVNKVWKHNISRLVEAMEQADACFFVSKRLLKQAKALGYSGKNSVITYNGVDTALFEQQTMQKHKRVGFIGSMKKIKGADFLPDIFHKIHQADRDVSFTVIGDGPLRAEVEKNIAQMDIDCELLGLVDYDEIPEIMKTIDVLVVPSRNEGLPLVILEANAMNIPVVGTSSGGIPEAIGFEENIIPFDEQLPENMARRVNALLDDASQTSKYRDRVVDKFDWDKIVAIELKEYKKAYKSV
ncbi:Glycosyltransferase involved in cell wall bisynthesis [Alkalibacterium subtropicum]|uniref:Glycosyltransferase involved in cell wall bisynthesis n=1 Tax=Alkalibacterium subtropicum TaxID=753702 RepID=A0A1I1GHZ5_9LACT|nr:glycosyltransferase [Alkalibacterium subtropicum]SFC11046.1 Glycosyltransferase involved in cell wall bisynthesis [Alkalibacterium subtropicum]